MIEAERSFSKRTTSYDSPAIRRAIKELTPAFGYQ